MLVQAASDKRFFGLQNWLATPLWAGRATHLSWNRQNCPDCREQRQRRGPSQREHQWSNIAYSRKQDGGGACDEHTHHRPEQKPAGPGEADEG